MIHVFRDRPAADRSESPREDRDRLEWVVGLLRLLKLLFTVVLLAASLREALV